MSQARSLLVALTGGIASGKSAVAELFAEHGVPVLDTDQIARDVVAPGSPALSKLVQEFGPQILDAAGTLDRPKMRGHVFADASARKQLEAITHPAIREELARRSREAGGRYQIHVIPLLIETDRAEQYDRVLVVDCPEAQQLQRLMLRDGMSEEQGRRMIAAQATREQRRAVAHDVIDNHGSLADLAAHVERLHRVYCRLASREEDGPSLSRG